MQTESTSNVHRFNDLVAFSTENMPGTVYLEPDHALWLAEQLKTAAEDIGAIGFTSSMFQPREYPPEEESDG